MSFTASLIESNEPYATAFGNKGNLTMPPARKAIILTCMDARLHPEAIVGIAEGQAHIIRNAGGRASDALRSIVISQQLLGTEEIIVMHHTDCGMLIFTDDYIRTKLRESVPASAHAAVDDIAFLPFPDLEQSIKDDVAFLRGNPLVKHVENVTGWVYDVKTGKVTRVV